MVEVSSPQLRYQKLFQVVGEDPPFVSPGERLGLKEGWRSADFDEFVKTAAGSNVPVSFAEALAKKVAGYSGLQEHDERKKITWPDISHNLMGTDFGGRNEAAYAVLYSATISAAKKWSQLDQVVGEGRAALAESGPSDEIKDRLLALVQVKEQYRDLAGQGFLLVRLCRQGGYGQRITFFNFMGLSRVRPNEELMVKTGEIEEEVERVFRHPQRVANIALLASNF